jgi:signal transduction histidine kinase
MEEPGQAGSGAADAATPGGPATHARPPESAATQPPESAATQPPGVVRSGLMRMPPSPGSAAAPRRRRSLLAEFFLSPVSPASWKALGAILLGFFVTIIAFGIVTTLLSTGASLLIVIVGIPVVGLAIEAAKLFAVAERWRMSLVADGPLIPRPYRPLNPIPTARMEARIRAWAEAEFLDPSRWFDVVYVAIALPLAMLEFVVTVILWAIAVSFTLGPVVALVARLAGARIATPGPANAAVVLWVIFAIGLAMLPVAASATRGMAVLHRYVVEGLLCISPSEALQRENDRLRQSRSATVELEASELRRIERDLHDGAQQRLVMLAIDLSLAEDKVETDPEGAKTLIVEARDQARQALAEIREVVRGTAPAILLDRGLVAALGAVAGRSAVPTFIDSDLPPGDRLPHSVERAAYYVVSEALTNVGKHAGANRVEVTLRREPWRLGVWVRDDGRGGATIATGGGLAGLRDRVAALDGKLQLHSPKGGPTVLHVEFPLAPPAPPANAWGWPAPPTAYPPAPLPGLARDPGAPSGLGSSAGTPAGPPPPPGVPRDRPAT